MKKIKKFFKQLFDQAARLYKMYMQGARENYFPINHYGLFGNKKPECYECGKDINGAAYWDSGEPFCNEQCVEDNLTNFSKLISNEKS